MTLEMKAAIYTQYGAPEVLQIKKTAKPTPTDNEILIKIHATAVNSGDCRLRKANPFAVRFFFGLFKPKKNILGGVLSGEIEAVGKNVQKFKVGDAVFGMTMLQFGTYAECICLPEMGALAIKPANISHDEAAALPFGANTALFHLQKANSPTRSKSADLWGIRGGGVCGSADCQIIRRSGHGCMQYRKSGDGEIHRCRPHG